jgi:O-antigen ligase
MRVLQNTYSSFLDFIENTRLGAAAFRVARFGLFALAILVVAKVASGQFLSFTFSDMLFMALTALAFLLVFLRSEIGIVMIIATTSFIFYFDYLPTLSLYHFIPEIPILEQLRLQIGQGIMIYLLVLFFTSREVRTARQRLQTPLAPAALIFMLVIVFAATSGLAYKGVYLTRTVEASRTFSYYAMFFVTLLCLRGRREMNIMLLALYAMALVVAFLMFVQFAAGDRFKVFLGTNIRVESFGTRAGRILPPGSDLVWLVIPFVIAWIPLASARLRPFLTISLGLLLGGLLLTFTRTVWIGTIVSMALMAIMGRGEIRRGTIKMFLAVAIFVALLFVVLSLTSTDEENYVTPYIKRFTSIFHPETYDKTTSAGARYLEIQEAWPKIAQNPWLGIGVGGIYRYQDAWDDRLQAHYLQPVYYMHNAYFLLLTDAGILGLATCLVLYITFFFRAQKIYHQLKRPLDQAIVLSCIASTASVMVGAIMQPTLAASHDVPMVGVMFGVVEFLRYSAEQEAQGRQAVWQRFAAVVRR